MMFNTKQKETGMNITVRLILPTRVVELHGEPETVVEEMEALIALESDIGESYAEIIPFPTVNKRNHPSFPQLEFGDNDEK